MASDGGQTPDNVISELEQRPYSFDLFRAIRLLESQFPDFPRIGYSQSPSQDPIRFAQNPSLAFAPSSIEALRREGPDAIPKLFIRHPGVFGPNGALPLHITEYARDRQLNSGDNTLVAFVNVFHHRLISLFYRAWADNQMALDMDRPNDQRYAFYLGSLFGIGMESLQGRDNVQDHAKLYFAGRLSTPTRNAEGLECILKAYFSVKAEVESFVGRWLDLPSDSICRLGESPRTGSIGSTVVVGSHFYECQLNFRIRMGPMSLEDYERMLPNGDAFKRLQYWILNYVGEHFFWDVELILDAAEVPQVSLGQSGRLGWTTWLKSQPFTQDVRDLVLSPPSN
ncbi:MAG: Type secretion protein [Pedosphaera sp.]|nr:Type secretion protein [Pedosphaera sp.]